MIPDCAFALNLYCSIIPFGQKTRTALWRDNNRSSGMMPSWFVNITDTTLNLANTKILIHRIHRSDGGKWGIFESTGSARIYWTLIACHSACDPAGMHLCASSVSQTGCCFTPSPL
jgi:hypothetical protein